MIYLIITIIRNIIEPKIVGGQLGLHPVVTLASMVIGVKVLGGLGLFGFPIGLSLLVYLDKNGTINFLNTASVDDPDSSSDDEDSKKSLFFRLLQKLFALFKK
jgi:predicted PurR-regulated permease PerM